MTESFLGLLIISGQALEAGKSKDSVCRSDLSCPEDTRTKLPCGAHALLLPHLFYLTPSAHDGHSKSLPNLLLLLKLLSSDFHSGLLWNLFFKSILVCSNLRTQISVSGDWKVKLKK